MVGADESFVVDQDSYPQTEKTNYTSAFVDLSGEYDDNDGVSAVAMQIGNAGRFVYEGKTYNYTVKGTVVTVEAIGVTGMVFGDEPYSVKWSTGYTWIPTQVASESQPPTASETPLGPETKPWASVDVSSQGGTTPLGLRIAASPVSAARMSEQEPASFGMT